MFRLNLGPGQLGAGDHLTPRIKFSIVGQSSMWLYTNSTDILVQFFGDNHVDGEGVKYKNKCKSKQDVYDVDAITLLNCSTPDYYC